MLGIIVILGALAVGVVIAAMAASLDDHTAWLGDDRNSLEEP
jgi:hypothetical protein